MAIWIEIGAFLALCAVMFCWLIERSRECDESCDECKERKR